MTILEKSYLKMAALVTVIALWLALLAYVFTTESPTGVDVILAILCIYLLPTALLDLVSVWRNRDPFNSNVTKREP
jgi:hypothetical protein